MPTEPIGDIYCKDDTTGEYKKLTVIPDTTSILNSVELKYPFPQIDYNDFCVSVDLIMRKTHARGMVDVILGKAWTKRAGRYRRYVKRQAEKDRRKALNGGRDEKDPVRA